MHTNLPNEKLLVAFPGYINTLPLLYFLELKNNVFLIKDIPRKINESLRLGLIDVGLASSIFYARNHQEFLILPDISISATGKVKSVILYHQEPIENLSEKIIGITPETETSFGLLRIVLEEFLEINPTYVFLHKRYEELSPDERSGLSAYLAIGDEALLLEPRQYFSFSTDLAEFWLKKMGQPFVFALLVVRKECVEHKKSLIVDFLRELYLSRAKGLSKLSELAEISQTSLRKDLVYHYLQHLEYDFSGLKQRAFLSFCELLYKRSIIPEIPELNFFPL